MSHDLTRRALLGGAALALAAPLLPRAARAAGPRFSDYPFRLGVASGSPTPTGVVLWTRLAPEPLRGGGMLDERVSVRWEVALEPTFKTIVQKGAFEALPELAHSVHAEVDGLEPGRTYHYRFFAGQEVSPTGRTKTLPAPDARPERLKLAYGSCQHFEHGYFAAHRHILDEAPDLMIFLGDYIYESSWGQDPVRAHSGGGCVTRSLAEYRDRHAQYKTDPDLSKLHGAVPWLFTWDDHEVANDYADLDSERLEPDFEVRRQAAYQAYWEHMPLRMSQRPVNARMKIHEKVRYGRLADLYVLDGRQQRSKQACPRPGMGGSNVLERCPDLARPERSFLGLAQERWLAGELAGASATWNILAQQTVVTPVDRTPGPGAGIWTDGWDGYPAARRRLLDALANPRVQNPLILGGDIHCYVAADLRPDLTNPKSPIVASELCGTSIASQGPQPEQLDALRPENPQLLHASAAHRGYVTLELTAKTATATLRGIESERQRDSKVETLATFVVADGKRGLQQG
jgi:alkaline phosphatase D